jgi:hypothetical protein
MCVILRIIECMRKSRCTCRWSPAEIKGGIADVPPITVRRQTGAAARRFYRTA